jgi:Cysteine-rich secretory protein family
MKGWNRNVGFVILFMLCMAPLIVSAGNNTARTFLGVPWYEERPATKSVISPGTYSYGNPTAAEQAHLELINRARLNPQAEANRLLSGNLNEGPPYTTITTTPKQPLTFNAQLYAAAIGHSQDMIANNYFDHNSPGGSTPLSRITGAGYTPYTSLAENIALSVASPGPIDQLSTILGMHDNFVIDSGVTGRGHRVNIFLDNMKEVGIASATGSMTYGGSFWPAALTLTCDFGARSGNSFVLGVVYDDTNGNGYTAGEGISGVLISVVKSNGDTASTTTASAGGYGIPLPDGSYTVTARLSDGRELERDLTIAGQNVKIDFKKADFPSTPPPPDSTPNQFTFTDQTNVALSAVITSNTITVTGINTAAAISITGGEYSINGGSYTSSSGTVNNGNTVTVQLTSSGNYSTTTNATLTIGGVSDSFSVTTLPLAGPDTTPNQFTFTGRTNVTLSTVITSNTITVSGINTAAPISITGGTYSINGGSYTSSSGTVNNGNTVAVQLTSSGSYSTTKNAILTIGGVSDTFSVTTQAETPTQDTTPDQFTFTDQTGAVLSTLITSNTITVTGITSTSPISITGGTYSINGGPYTSASGTVSNSDTVTVQLTSSGNYSTTTNATLTIGGISDTFSVTTESAPPDMTPDQFTFTDQTDAALSAVITSNTITVTGITSTTPISITGGTYSINGGPYTSADGTVNPEDTVTVQQTSSGSHSTTTDATLTIGGISDTFSVTTIRGSNSTSSSSGGGGCFIATAAFGSPLAGQVEILRQFRDRYLLTNDLGRKFVSWYYRNGPVAAQYIKDKPLIKAAVRMALYPLIGFSYLLISGYFPIFMVGFLLSILLFFRFGQKNFSDI